MEEEAKSTEQEINNLSIKIALKEENIIEKEAQVQLHQEQRLMMRDLEKYKIFYPVKITI